MDPSVSIMFSGNKSKTAYYNDYCIVLSLRTLGSKLCILMQCLSVIYWTVEVTDDGR